jgi:hypothetical protein
MGVLQPSAVSPQPSTASYLLKSYCILATIGSNLNSEKLLVKNPFPHYSMLIVLDICMFDNPNIDPLPNTHYL